MWLYKLLRRKSCHFTKHMAVVSSRLLFLLSAILIPIQPSALLIPYLFPPTCNNNTGNYTRNSTYKTNLNQVLSSLYSNTTIDYGFYYSSYGQNPDKVYAIGVCRGDVNPDDCRGCLKNSSTLLTQDCPNQKEAVGWCDQCMLRYSNSSIFGIMDTSFHVLVCDMQNVSADNLAQFNDDVNILLNNLTSEAAAGGSLRKYAARSAITTDFRKIYALVQCTPDLSEQDCINCLLYAIAAVPDYCAGKVGRLVVLTSCNIKYTVHPFFDSTTASAPSSTNTTTTSEGIHAIMPII